MRRALTAEAYKLGTTRSNAGIAVGMIGLIALAVLVHAYGLPVAELADREGQRNVLVEVGINLGMLFAALLGALTITGEYRTGTIRPTLLVTPHRETVIAAKTATALPAGALMGLLAAATALAAGAVGFSLRDIGVELTAGDGAWLILGGATGGALWAVVGLGVGAVIRNQVPAVVALLVWLLFVENVLAELPEVHHLLPGAAARALGGLDREGLPTPAAGALLLVGYAVVAAGVGLVATRRRDVA